MLRHGFGETVVLEDKIQKITALNEFQHEIYKQKPSSENKINKQSKE